MWGGCETFGCNDFGQNPLIDAAWDPATDRWRELGVRLAPEPRGWHSTVVAGEQILVWGGEAGGYSVPTGGIYCGGSLLASPGEVAQLRLVKDRATGELVASWTPSCAASGNDYIVYEGSIGNWDTWTPAQCSSGGATVARIPATTTAGFLVVIPRDVDSEGGVSRPSRVTSCLARHVASTCR